MFRRKVILTDIVPPFSFERSAFWGNYTVLWRYDTDRHELPVAIPVTSGQTCLLRLSSAGDDVDRPALCLDICSDEAIGSLEEDEIRQQLDRVFRLGYDLRPFYAQVEGNAVMCKLITRLRGFRPPTCFSFFEMVVVAICNQRCRPGHSIAMAEHLRTEFGTSITDGAKRYATFPSPQTLAACSVAELKAKAKVGFRAPTIKTAAEAISELPGGELETSDREHVFAWLTAIKGSGPATAEGVLGFWDSDLRDHQTGMDADLGIKPFIEEVFFDRMHISDSSFQAFMTDTFGCYRRLALQYLFLGWREIKPVV